MDRYDDLFEETAPDGAIFRDKGALDPLADPEDIVARDEQERRLATILNGVHEGYLPTTVSVYGPPGTGKTLATRRVCQEFARRHDEVAVEYVNLKECRTLFSAANEILFEVQGQKLGAYRGLDGVFEELWTALADYPAWTVLILDEIDHIKQDSNYDPSDFFYRLLRGEGKRKRGIDLSAFLISNELLSVDLRLDSRVRSAMSGEEVFFPPYDRAQLTAILGPRLDRAFREGALPAEVREHGIEQAARRWGDARKALTLFRHAGETAADRELEQVTEACLDANLTTAEKEAVVEKLRGLPQRHQSVLIGLTVRSDARTGEIIQPVTTAELAARFQEADLPEEATLGQRAIREVVTDLETMGLVETWIDSRGREGRVKQIETTFEPRWVRAVMDQDGGDET